MFKCTFILCLIFFMLPIYGNLVTNHTIELQQYKSVPVYGIDSSEYLKSIDTVKSSHLSEKKYLRHKVGFNLPDSFYFFGAPIFLLVLLRIMAMFIKNFEDERKEELKRQSIKFAEPK